MTWLPLWRTVRRILYRHRLILFKLCPHIWTQSQNCSDLVLKTTQVVMTSAHALLIPCLEIIFPFPLLTFYYWRHILNCFHPKTAMFTINSSEPCLLAPKAFWWKSVLFFAKTVKPMTLNAIKCGHFRKLLPFDWQQCKQVMCNQQCRQKHRRS